MAKSCKNIAKSAKTFRFRRKLLELLGGFEPPTSSLPSDKMLSSRCGTRVCGRFCRKKDEVGNSLLHVFRSSISACGSWCGSAAQSATVWVNFRWQGNGHTFCAAENNKKVSKRRHRATGRRAQCSRQMALQVFGMGQNVGQSVFNASRNGGRTS